ncbi:MAG: hypothetical protein ACIARR_03160 [Phycisphaerales bacterium JB059]
MYGVVLSVTGVVFAVWQLLPPANRELSRARIQVKRRALLQLSVSLIVVVVIGQLGATAIGWACPGSGAFTLAIGQAVAVAMMAWMAALAWPTGRWNYDLLRQFHPRLESLILNGHSATVTDVLDAALPKADGEDAVSPIDPDSESLVETMLRDALSHRVFIRSATRHNRQFMAKVLRRNSWAVVQRVDAILDELLFGPDPLLVHELQDTTNYQNGENHRYRIPDRCNILHALFDDINVADRLGCWTPIGDGIREAISQRRGSPSQDPDQRLCVRDWEAGRWDSPVGAGLWFFRVMATSAAAQDHSSHMWIPYLYHIAQEIVDIVEVPEDEGGTEFPNPYCRWLYDCVECCSEVIHVVERLDPQSKICIAIQNNDNSAQLIEAALYTYGKCVAIIARSESPGLRSLRSSCIQSLALDYERWQESTYPEGMSAFAANHLQDRLTDPDRSALANQLQALYQHDPHKEVYKDLAQIFMKEGE